MQHSKKPQATALDRLALVRERIARAARDAERDPQDVTLVCVSKTFAAPDIVPYDRRPAPAVVVRPRRRDHAEGTSDSSPGA